LEGTEWIEGLAFSKNPKIEYIKPRDLENVVDQTKTLKDPSEITSMALANLAIDIVGGNDEMSEILKKAGNK